MIVGRRECAIVAVVLGMMEERRVDEEEVVGVVEGE